MPNKIVISTNDDSYKEENMIENIRYLFHRFNIENVVDIETTMRTTTKEVRSDDNTLFYTTIYQTEERIIDRGGLELLYGATLFIRIIDNKIRIVKNRYADLGIKNGDNLKQLIRDKKLNELV